MSEPSPAVTASIVTAIVVFGVTQCHYENKVEPPVRTASDCSADVYRATLDEIADALLANPPAVGYARDLAVDAWDDAYVQCYADDGYSP